MAPCAWKAPVTHHRTVVRTCHWYAETKFPAGINLVQTAAPDWRQIESLMALDLIIIPAVIALLYVVLCVYLPTVLTRRGFSRYSSSLGPLENTLLVCSIVAQ